MTIDEAMTDLSIQLEVKRGLGLSRQADAITLGIEALKALKLHRRFMHNSEFELMPGETEESERS